MPSNRDDRTGTTGTLYVVATPIGNLGDISFRAIEALRSVDLIAAEDTRHTRKLLTHFDIHKRLSSYHEHNAAQRGPELIDRLAARESIALVTDAGTPGISDPGALLIQAALEHGIPVIAVPGATALISALVVSGLSPHPFAFLGFAPARGASRRAFFSDHARLPMTLVCYESPKRLQRTLEDMLEAWGDRRVAVARELTKIHEEVFRGTVAGALAHFSGEVRGELTLVVEGFQEEAGATAKGWEEALRELLLKPGISVREAAAEIASRFSLPRRTVYQHALELRTK